MKRGRDENRFGPPSRRLPGGGQQDFNVLPRGPMQDPFLDRGQATSANSIRLTTNDALSYLRDVKAKFADQKHIYDTFLEIMKKFKASRINTEGVIDQVKTLFKGHRELILGFNTFLPKGFEIVMAEEEPKAAVEFDQAINYVNKIKTRFAHDERVYKNFLEILNMYRKGTKSISEVYEEVSILFSTHNDLLTEFTYFLPESQSAAEKHNSANRRGIPANRNRGREPDFGRGPRGRALDVNKELLWFGKVKDRLKSRESYNEFMKIIELYTKDVVTRQEMVSMVHDQLMPRYQDLAVSFESTMNRLEAAEYDFENLRHRVPTRDTRRGQAEKFGMRPISDMDVSTWERSMTSYVKLPKGYPKLKASHQTATGRMVLQDDWVSVTSGSEDYSFKHMRKNQYEEALFRCEDDRFELDMAIECCRSTINAFTRASQQIRNLSQEDRENYRLPRDALADIHVRMVQKIYGIMPGEKGAEMVDILKKNPVVVVDIVLGRLVQKEQEWEKDKLRMTEVWQRMYDANYHKSLDHRSFYFKQTDKKILGQKIMMQEIREAAEKHRSEHDNTQMANIPNANLRLAPDIKYNFKATVVHEDMRKIIKRCLDDIVSPELSEKAMKMWLEVIEPLFGLSIKPLEDLSPKSEDPKEVKEDLDGRIKDEGEASGDNRDGSMAPSATEDENNPDDPAALLKAIGKIASGRINERASSEEQADGSEADFGDGLPKTEAEAVDEDSNEAYQNCKPIFSTILGQLAQSSGDAPPSGRVLYGNELLYILFRLHQHLFERLRTARRCALLIADPAHRQLSEAQQDQEIGNLPEPAQKVHNEFLSLVFQLMVGPLDSSSFEDRCRSLLGTSSYTVFTLDKLIYKLVKQIQQVIQDESCTRLLDLYKYEKCRGLPVIDSIYHQNAHVVLHEDQAYRFESRQDGEFWIQLLDPYRTEVQSSAMPPHFERQVQSYLYSPASMGKQAQNDQRIRQPYMLRNLPDPEFFESDKVYEMSDGIEMYNSLDCKFLTKEANPKITFVLDTEDYFRRPHKARKNDKLDLERRRKFSAWIKHTLEENTRPVQPVPVQIDAPMPQQP